MRFGTTAGLTVSMPIEPSSSVCPSGAALMTCAGREVAVGAGAVLDHDRPAEAIRQLLSDQPREEIEAAAGRIGHDDEDVPGGELARVLRQRSGAGETRGRDPGEDDGATTIRAVMSVSWPAFPLRDLLVDGHTSVVAARAVKIAADAALPHALEELVTSRGRALVEAAPLL